MCPSFARGNCIGVPGIFGLAAEGRSDLPRPPDLFPALSDWQVHFLIFAHICSIHRNITY